MRIRSSWTRVQHKRPLRVNDIADRSETTAALNRRPYRYQPGRCPYHTKCEVLNLVDLAGLGRGSHLLDE